MTTDRGVRSGGPADAGARQGGEGRGGRRIRGAGVDGGKNKVAGGDFGKGFLRSHGRVVSPGIFMSLVANCLMTKGCVALQSRPALLRTSCERPRRHRGPGHPVADIAALLTQNPFNPGGGHRPGRPPPGPPGVRGVSSRATMGRVAP